MNVTIEELMKHLNADDSEKPVIQMYLDNAKPEALEDINRPYSDLSKTEKPLFNQIVLELATSHYLNRDGSGKGVTKSFSGLNSQIDLLRKPPLGD